MFAAARTILRFLFCNLRLFVDPKVWPLVVRFVRAARRNTISVNRNSEDKGRTGHWSLKTIYHHAKLYHARPVRNGAQWVMNSLIPPIPSEAMNRSLMRFEKPGYTWPHSAHLALTSQCPSNCRHCSVKGRPDGPALITADWRSVIDQLNHLGVSIIAFTGGEPLLRHDLNELVGEASRGGAAVQLLTSGWGLSSERLTTLRNSGLWAIGVGLDHTDAAVVDASHQFSGSFATAIAALKLSRSFGLYTFINAIADQALVASGEYRRLYELACHLGVHELRLIEAARCGGLAYGQDERLLRPRDVSTLRAFHREANSQRRHTKVCAFSEIESPDLLGCIAGTLHLYVDPAGEVCPCDLAPFSFGNVLSEQLDVIWRRMSGAMGQPRRHCFMKDNAEDVYRYATTHGVPLPVEISCQIAGESPSGPLPDYFETVTKPFGFPQS